MDKSLIIKISMQNYKKNMYSFESLIDKGKINKTIKIKTQSIKYKHILLNYNQEIIIEKLNFPSKSDFKAN